MAFQVRQGWAAHQEVQRLGQSGGTQSVNAGSMSGIRTARLRRLSCKTKTEALRIIEDMHEKHVVGYKRKR